MKSRPDILVLMAVLALMLTANIQAQTANPPYLSQMPSTARVRAEVKGTDALDTAARQMGAFKQLMELINTLAGPRYQSNEFTPDESRVKGNYFDAWQRFTYRENSPPPQDQPRWAKLRAFYEKDPGFLDELLRRFFSPEFRAQYYRATGKQPPNNQPPSQPRNTQPSAPAAVSAEAFKAQGDKYRKAEDYPNAIEAYKRAIAINPSYADAYYLLATCYSQTEQWQLALATWKKAQTFGQMNPSSIMLLGEAHLKLRQYDEALEVFRSVFRLQPELQDVVGANHWIGRTYFDMGQYENAVSAFQEALRLNPNDGNSFPWLGASYFELKQYPKAVTAYQQATRLRPKDGSAYFNLGYLYLKTGRKQEALQVYRTLLTLDKGKAQELYAEINEGPSSRPSAKGGNATSPSAGGGGRRPRPAQGAPSARVAPETAPKPSQPKASAVTSAEAFVTEGNKYSEAKDYMKAVEAYKKAVSLQPFAGADNAEIHLRMAIAYFNLFQFRNAETAAQQAIRLKPDYQVAYNWLGTIDQVQEKHSEAIIAYQQAVRLDPNDKESLNLLGRTFVKLGRQKDALQVYRKLLLLDKKMAQELYAEINTLK
jgi:tetratricopeptide (TPR) repeat protein